jgi:signal peptidase II
MTAAIEEKNAMKNWTRLGLVAFILFTCVGCDQISKEVVRNHIALGDSHSYLADTFRLTHAENPGAFLSIGAALPESARVLVFQVGVALVILLLLWYALFVPLDRGSITGFALLAASGVGNLIDRVMQDGHVTDFLNLGLGAVRTGIFNVADVLGVVGVLILLQRQLIASRATAR